MPIFTTIKRHFGCPMGAVMGIALGAFVQVQDASARPPDAVTKAQAASSLFVTVPPNAKPVSYVLAGKMWTARAQRGVGETIKLPAGAKNISLSAGTILTSSIPGKGGEVVRTDYTVTRPITLQALTAKGIMEIGPYLLPGALVLDASGKVNPEKIAEMGQSGNAAAPVLRSPIATKAPDCNAIHSAVKRFVTDYPEKVLETVALQIGQNESCACEVVKAAIIASRANNELVVEIVKTAIEAAPGKFRIIGQCAIAVAPDSLSDVQAIISRYGSVGSDSGPANGELMGMVHIPAGVYPGPQGIPIKTGEFWMDAHEVTIRQYAEFLKAISKLSPAMKAAYQHDDQPLHKKSHEPDDWQDLYHAALSEGRWNRKKVGLNYPVVGVDWWDAYAYARWRGRQLPTYEEWYAACSSGCDPAKLSARGWKAVDHTDTTTHGIRGMAGNVSEWLRDKTLDPADPSRPARYMISGASHRNPKFGAQAREWVDSRSLRRSDLGFRTSIDSAHYYSRYGEKWAEKGDDKGGKGGAGGDLGQEAEDEPLELSAAELNQLANAVDFLSETTINPFNVLDDIVTDGNTRFIGSTDVKLPNPVRRRRVVGGGSYTDYYGTQDNLNTSDRMIAFNPSDDQFEENAEGGRGWDTEKGGYGDDTYVQPNTTGIYATVIGEVGDPGEIRLPSSGKIDIFTAIMVAGDFTVDANRIECILQRNNTSKEEAVRIPLRDIKERKQAMVYLYPGDMVTIHKSR